VEKGRKGGENKRKEKVVRAGRKHPGNKFLVKALNEQFVTSSDSLGNTTTLTPIVSDAPATFNA